MHTFPLLQWISIGWLLGSRTAPRASIMVVADMHTTSLLAWIGTTIWRMPLVSMNSRYVSGNGFGTRVLKRLLACYTICQSCMAVRTR